MSSDVILEANSIMQTPFDTRHNAQSMRKGPQSWLKAAGSLVRIGLH
jgi:cytochrome bd-type quinol oxidase subunit 1